MQFIFGDNTSKYTLLFYDDKQENAAKIKDMIRIPYSPNERFDSYGFIPFGSNNNRALFFKFQKDIKMVRNVYILHGVYTEISPEYFHSEVYKEGLCTDFIDQDSFDTLRHQLLDGKKDCMVPYSFDKALASTPESQVVIDENALCAIVSKIYQRNKVVLVMDDENFSNDRVRLVIKKIFSYLTPSLRKICSYVSAVDNTGEMDFLVRIIPRSMLQKNERAIDLDYPSDEYVDKSDFPSIANYLINLSDKERNNLFETYELLSYGKETIYKKADFLQFIKCYTAADNDEAAIESCDKILGDYLCDERCPDEPLIPDFLKRALTDRYGSANWLNDVIVWEKVSLDKIDRFYDQYMDIIKKVYYLCDRSLAYFDSVLGVIYERKYTSDEIRDLDKLLSNMNKCFESMRGAKSSEGVILSIAKKKTEYLYNFVAMYHTIFDEAIKYTDEKIKLRYKNNLVTYSKDLINEVKNRFLPRLVKLNEYIDDIDSHFGSILQSKCIDVHNEECERRMKEENDLREKAYREEMLSVFESILASEELELSKALKLKEKKGARNKTKDAPNRDDFAFEAVDVFFDKKEQRQNMPTEMDMLKIVGDEELCPRLADLLAKYIVNVCMVQGSDSFRSTNHNLYLASCTSEIALAVAEKLCQMEHTEMAVLYLAVYEPAMDRMAKRIMKIKSVDNINAKGMKLLKRELPIIFDERGFNDDISDENRDYLVDVAKKLCKSKSTSSQRRTLCSLLLKSAVLSNSKAKLKNSPMGKFDNKRMLMWIFCAVASLVALAALALGFYSVLSDDKEDVPAEEVTTEISGVGEEVSEEVGDEESADSEAASSEADVTTTP